MRVWFYISLSVAVVSNAATQFCMYTDSSCSGTEKCVDSGTCVQWSSSASNKVSWDTSAKTLTMEQYGSSTDCSSSSVSETFDYATGVCSAASINNEYASYQMKGDESSGTRSSACLTALWCFALLFVFSLSL
uniref:Ig-like domain-containing protein n=1 Tax=Chromera velia CCMP2878 TaxID=1169474 RepID=A0A0G4HS51_9ALVE|eukprot:Cvel_1301.t1-p1 / transcript=Cvel_1301.t1 / gene=Cvel_1301 / organism=Chromera_velia_CCMP2878 / gene_product=hypothetical protein / transcript_product=hypothetical protein / location=Cvel_scaffold44:47809-48204(+) / protein_length=132 / sequence_SO=supercontig / SO=protein_coding / is_pseudo=false